MVVSVDAAVDCIECGSNFLGFIRVYFIDNAIEVLFNGAAERCWFLFRIANRALCFISELAAASACARKIAECGDMAISFSNNDHVECLK